MDLTFLLAFGATATEMAACLICARNLYKLQRENWDRSRRILTEGCLLCGLMALAVLLANIAMAVHDLPFFLLQPWVALIYLAMNIVMVLYPISVIKPDWLTPLHGLYLFLPVLILGIVFLTFTDRWTLLYEPQHILNNLSQPDVIARLVAVFLMIPYCFIPVLLPYRYRETSANQRWIGIYSGDLLLICITHAALMVTNNGILLIVMPILVGFFYYFSTEFELKERLRPNGKESGKETGALHPQDNPELMEMDLWGRVCQLMDKEEVWRDPDLSMTSLSQMCATNVTYLGRIIQQETGKGFKEMVNAKRVSSVVAQIRQNPDTDIQTAFFNAGYRSRTTAWRNFKDITGSSPADYRMSIKLQL